MQCQQFVYPNKKKNRQAGQCEAKAAWKIRIHGIITFELYVCDEHFAAISKSTREELPEWSATPIQETKICVTKSAQP